MNRKLSFDEQQFWDEYPGLLFNDPEMVPYDDLIERLRHVAQAYWKEKQDEIKC